LLNLLYGRTAVQCEVTSHRMALQTHQVSCKAFLQGLCTAKYVLQFSSNILGRYLVVVYKGAILALEVSSCLMYTHLCQYIGMIVSTGFICKDVRYRHQRPAYHNIIKTNSNMEVS